MKLLGLGGPRGISIFITLKAKGSGAVSSVRNREGEREREGEGGSAQICRLADLSHLQAYLSDREIAQSSSVYFSGGERGEKKVGMKSEITIYEEKIVSDRDITLA